MTTKQNLLPRVMSLAVHELRTPVTVVSGYLRMVLKEQGGPLSEKQRRMLEEAERSCNRISALVAEGNGTVRIEMRVPAGDGAERAGVVRVDGHGAIIEVRTGPPRPGAWDVLRRLHHGNFAGWASRILYAVVGLALPVLSITGYMISMRRHA